MKQKSFVVLVIVFVLSFIICLLFPYFLDLFKSESVAQTPPVPTLIQSRQQNIPTIAQHIFDAQTRGFPIRLSRIRDNQPLIDRNRREACRNFIAPSPPNTSCDEYPFASTYQGGAGASIRGVPPVEQNRQGGIISRFYTTNNIPDRGIFEVLPVP